MPNRDHGLEKGPGNAQLGVEPRKFVRAGLLVEVWGKGWVK